MKKILICTLLFPLFVLAQKPYRGAEYRTIETFTYGRFEVRMRSAEQSGMLSSFFTYHETPSADQWNEIDIEILGRYNDQVQFNTITPNQSNHVFTQTVPFNPHADFHLYAIEWTPDYVSWWVDSVEVYRQTGEHIATLFRPQKLMMNIWPPIYEDWTGKLNPNYLPVYAYYDWVKVYQFTPGENRDFTLLWQDEFDVFNQQRWQKATHTWDGNNSIFVKENAVLQDGYLILCLTKPTNLGYNGGPIEDSDQTPPYIASAWLFNQQIRIEFSEKVEQLAAEKAENYIIPGLTVERAILKPNGRTVILKVSSPQAGINYNIIATNITDLAPKPNTIKVRSVPVYNGLVLPALINLGKSHSGSFYQSDLVFGPQQPYGREGGQSFNVESVFTNVTNPEDSLFLSEVRNLRFYRIRVPDGMFKLTFFFAENEFSSAGARVFSIKAEDQIILKDVDIWKQVGAHKPLILTVENVVVNDGKLDLYFQAKQGEPVCSALKIEMLPTAIKAQQSPSQTKTKRFVIFPNPANPFVHFEVPAGTDLNWQIEVYNVNGQKQATVRPSDLKNGQLQIGHWPSGIYFCLFKQGNQVIDQQKFVVVK